MTNSKLWQTASNTNNANNVILLENNLTAAKKSDASSKNSLRLTAKDTQMPKRYSFDDNGGGYLGL